MSFSYNSIYGKSKKKFFVKEAFISLFTQNSNIDCQQIFLIFRITSYSFEVCDSLLNVGPCSQIAMGEPAFLSDEFSGNAKADPDVELVSTSGNIQILNFNFC